LLLLRNKTGNVPLTLKYVANLSKEEGNNKKRIPEL